MSSNVPLKGFVLAAGFGQRMAPITETVPKPLLPVGQLPLIGYALHLLRHHGIVDVIVNLHHLAKNLKEALGDGSQYGVNITYSFEEEILGTGGGLKKMHDAIDTTTVVVNSDTVVDVDLAHVVAEHQKRNAIATLVLREDPRRDLFGQIEIDDHGRVCRILGQGDNIPQGNLRSFMFTGVHIIEPRFLEYIPPELPTCVIRYGYTKAMNNNEPLFGSLCDGYWADAGTPARYFEANVDALSARMKLRHVDPLGGGPSAAAYHDVIEGVHVRGETEIGEQVQLKPRSLLGEGVRLGDRAQVGPMAVLGERVQVGKDAQVSESIVLDGVKIESGARVHRMLVGKKATLSLTD